MRYEFKYQNDDYLINIDKIEYVIKSNNRPKNRVCVFLSNNNLQFDFNSEDEAEEFYEQLQWMMLTGSE